MAAVVPVPYWLTANLSWHQPHWPWQRPEKLFKTVESFGGDDTDAVPQAFVKHDAQQCGFCTPGFVVAVRAFLNKTPNATESQIRQGLNGNICRCGTYNNIIKAALDVVKGGV